MIPLTERGNGRGAAERDATREQAAQGVRARAFLRSPVGARVFARGRACGGAMVRCGRACGGAMVRSLGASKRAAPGGPPLANMTRACIRLGYRAGSEPPLASAPGLSQAPAGRARRAQGHGEWG